MTNRWLRNKIDGTLYGWDPYIAQNPKVEEITEQEAFPERFTPEHVKERVAELATTTEASRKRRKRVDISTEELPETIMSLNLELNADASRGLE